MTAKRSTPDPHGGRAVPGKDWDAAVAQLRAALAQADRGARPELRASLAVCLSNRAAEHAEKAMKTLAPDDATRRMVAADRALTFFRTGKPASRRKRKGTGRRRWAWPHLELSWSEVAAWLILLSPFWIPFVLWQAGWISENTAGDLMAIFWLVWLGGQGLIALVDWLKSQGNVLLPSTPVVDRSQPCEVKGCSEPGQYEMRLDKLLGSPELPMAAWNGGAWRMCAKHARVLEEELKAPIVNPRALTAMLEAKADLEEAVHLAPKQPMPRQNLQQVKEILAQLRAEGVDTRAVAKD